MRIDVTGRQLDLGEAFQTHAATRLEEAVAKYAIRATEAGVTVSKQGHLFICDCVAHMSTGLTAQASAQSEDVYSACDQAINRLEKQLRRHKRRLKDHHQRRKEPIAHVGATAYVLADAGEEEGPSGDTAAQAAPGDTGTAPSAALAHGDTPPTGAEDSLRAVIVAEGTDKVPALSVGEAVMQMELNDASFLLFVNEARGRLNAVYRRSDGNIGWIDPDLTSKA